MTDHPITPPPELVQQWLSEFLYEVPKEQSSTYIAARAAQWGADHQLKADAKWLDQNSLNAPHLTITPIGKCLVKEMRPKPPSLKEQALALIDDCTDSHGDSLDDDILGGYLDNNALSIIRRALEALPDD